MSKVNVCEFCDMLITPKWELTFGKHKYHIQCFGMNWERISKKVIKELWGGKQNE